MPGGESKGGVGHAHTARHRPGNKEDLCQTSTLLTTDLVRRGTLIQHAVGMHALQREKRWAACSVASRTCASSKERA